MKKIVFLIGLLSSSLTVHAQFFSENFDSLTNEPGQQIPEGWTADNRNNDNAFWDVLPNSTNFPNNARSAPNGMHMSFDIDDPADDWLFTPPLALRKDYRYTVRFWYRKIDTGFGTVEKLKVHLGTSLDATMVDSIPLFSDTMITNDDYQLAEFSFIATDSAEYYLAFHAFSEPFQFLLAFDDLEIEEEVVNSTQAPEWAQQLKVFPNPASDLLQFRWSDELRDAQIQLYDEQGGLVREKNQVQSGQQVAIDDLPPGIYAYLIRDQLGRQTSGRFTIIR